MCKAYFGQDSEAPRFTFLGFQEQVFQQPASREIGFPCPFQALKAAWYSNTFCSSYLPAKRTYAKMRLLILPRDWFTILFLAGTLSIGAAMTVIEASSASARAAKESKQAVTSAEATAQRYAEA